MEQGDISAVRGPCSELHYDHLNHDHCHVHCSVCGSVRDVELASAELEGLIDGVASGYCIENVYIIFTGVCPSCRTGEEGEER